MAGMMALNVVMGFQHRLVLDYVGGAGFVGIAVALMGRAHPVGIVLAAMLFGILYQGGAELAFEMPAISRDMIVVIQALVILFTGALENLLRVPVERAFLRLRAERRRDGLSTPSSSSLGSSLRLVDAAAARLPRRPLLRARRHLRHRARGQDAGRRLRRRRLRGGHRLGLARAPRRRSRVSALLALLHGFASITLSGNQIISGVAINFLASGLTAFLGQNWFGRAARRRSSARRSASCRSTAAAPRRSRRCR